jgi:uncharacterized membrane protein
MSTEVVPVPGLWKGRLGALSEGIFATIMTVLALSLSVPIITGQGATQGVSYLLSTEAPLALSCIVSFGILGVFWVAHHVMVHYVRWIDRSFLWINILFLMTLGFVPFTTALLGRHPLQSTVLVPYDANVTGIGFALLAI